MRIIVNHLTRMQSGYVCVAGIDDDDGHVRPVLEKGRLRRDVLRSESGPFSLGSVVDLGDPEPRPTPPEVEDVVVDLTRTVGVEDLDAGSFQNALDAVAAESLPEVFGPELEKLSGTAAAVPRGTGSASLGVLRVGRAELKTRQTGKPEIRLRLADPDLGDMSLKVTDLRLWEADQITPAAREIEAIGVDSKNAT